MSNHITTPDKDNLDDKEPLCVIPEYELLVDTIHLPEPIIDVLEPEYGEVIQAILMDEKENIE